MFNYDWHKADFTALLADREQALAKAFENAETQPETILSIVREISTIEESLRRMEVWKAKQA